MKMRKTALKRVLSLVLAMCMIFSILPPASAADWTVTASLDNQVNCLGDKALVSVTVSDGGVPVTDGVSIVSCVASAPEVIEVRGDSSSGFSLAAISEGAATITVTAKYDGEEKSAKIDLSIAGTDAMFPHVLEMSENIPDGNLTADMISYSLNGWVVDTAKTAASTLSTAGWFKFYGSSQNDVEDCLVFRLAQNAEMGFKFYIPVAGEYKLELTENGVATPELTAVDVSVYKNENGEYSQVGNTWNYEMKGAGNAPAVTYMTDAVTLQKGWHTVTFKNVNNKEDVDSNANSYKFKRIALVPTPTSRTVELKKNIDDSTATNLLKDQAKINTHGWEIVETATTYAKHPGWLKANSARMKRAERATYRFYLPAGRYAIQAKVGAEEENAGKIYIDNSSSDAKSIPAAATDINLGIAAYAAGYHTITIENYKDAGYNDSTVSYYPHSFTFTQIQDGDIGYTLDAEISEKIRYTGDSAKINVNAVGTGIDLEADKLEVTYSAEPTGVLDISEEGVVTAIGSGTATITVYTLYADNKEPVTYSLDEITVLSRPTEQEPVVINLYKGMENQTGIYNIATIENNNFEVCPAPETTSRIFGYPTHFMTDTNPTTGDGLFKMRLTGPDEQVTLKTYIPVAGEYKLNLSGGKDASGGDLMISVTDGGNEYTEVGDYTFKTGADGSNARENVYVGSVKFETPGYKKIKLKRINAIETDNANFYPAEFTFVPNSGESTAAIEANLLDEITYVGHKSRLFVKITDGDVTIPLSKVALTYTDDKNVVEVSEDGSQVTAVAAGDTNLVISCSYAGKSLSCNVPISVKEMPKIGEDLVITFDDADLVNPSLAGTVPATIEKHGWRVHQSSNNKRWYYKADHLQMRMDSKQDDINNYYAAFEVNVPISGYYRFDFTSQQHGEGAAMVRLLVNDKYVGEYDFDPYPENDNAGETIHMNTVWLDGGYQVIKVKWIKSGSEGNVWIKSFALTALEAMPTLASVKCKVKKKILYPGEKTTFSADAIMSTGYAYFFDSEQDTNKITYSVSNEEILRVEEDGTVTALKDGNAKVIATATVDGVEMSGEIEIEVAKAYINSVSAHISKSVIFPEDSADITFNVSLSNGKRADVKFVDISVEEYDDKIKIDDETMVITALKDGESGFNVTATLAGESVTVFVPVTVTKRVLELHHVELTPEKGEIKVGETLKITAQGIQFNGEPSDLSELEIFYDTLDSSIATIDKNGVVCGVAEGETDVVVHIRKGEFIRSATAGIKVSGYAEVESAEIKLQERIYVGTAVHAETVATLKGGAKITVPAANVTYEIKKEPAPGSVSVDSQGMLTATETGSAVISATVTLGDTPVETEDFAFIISEAQVSNTVIIDFMKYKSTVETVKPTEIEIESEGWEINREETSSYMMSLEGQTNGRFSIYRGGFNTMAQVLDTPTVYENGKTNNSSDLAFDVKIPEDGVYALTVGGTRYNAGCLASVYVDGEYIGNYDFDMENRGGTAFNCIKLNAGVHTVTFRAITGSRSDDKYHYFIIGSLVFNRVATGDAFVDLEAEAESSYLIVGETVDITAKAKMADGKYFNFDPSDKWPSKSIINITSSNPDVVRVNEDGTITAIAKDSVNDSVNITVDALIEGERITKSFPITVDEQKLTTIEARLSDELSVGGVSKLMLTAKTEQGRTINVNSLENLDIRSSDHTTVKVDGFVLHGLRAGSATISGSAEINGNSADFELEVAVTEPLVGKLELKADAYVMRRTNTEGLQLRAIGYDALGNKLDLSSAGVAYESLTPEILTVTEGGLVKPAGQEGSGKIRATINLGGAEISAEVVISVRDGKVSSTYYTAAKVEAARENIQKYSWANSTKEAAVKKAEKYLELTDFIWENVTTQELPRSTSIGHMDDPGHFTCKYCGANMYDAQYSTSGYGWLIDPINKPWKIQCAACRRSFPSNDFWSFYKLGVKDGVWSYKRSLEENQKIVDLNDPDQPGFLVNKEHPEKDKELGIDGWGVDDGYGYRTGEYIKTNKGEIEIEHTYIAYYNLQGIFSTQEDKPALLYDAVTSLRDAYLYTGDIKYGRVGAIILDRFADVYPAMDSGEMALHWGMGVNQARGKITTRIPEPTLIYQYILAYDALFDVYDDPYVVDYLKERAEQNHMKNDKADPEKIRDNLEDGILRAAKAGCDSGQINGNFGNNSMVVSTAALVLDNHPETLEWIEWLNKPEETWAYPVNGGSIMPQIMEIVDRDGFGDEGAITYNMWWSRTLSSTAQALKLYNDAYPNADVFNLYEEPKYKKMLLAELPILLSRDTTPHVGDGGQTAVVFSNTSLPCNIDYFQNTGDIDMAQAIYLQQKGNVDDLKYDIFTKNPESLSREIKNIIKEHGEYDVNKSNSVQGFGFSILKDGAAYKDVIAGETANTQRNFWISWIQGYGHRHPDKLNLGIEAWGLNISPDMGYTRDSYGDEYEYWGHSTLSHNTVVVNEQSQAMTASAGTLLHFDDGGDVQLMDIDGKNAYPTTDIYRRSLVMINVDDTISYGVDFFHVRGGYDHLYSFHALSDNVTLDVDTVRQTMGSYAGPDIPWGTSPTLTAYSWLDNVRRAKNPQTGEFSADFKIRDFRNTLGRGEETNLHLRMTMLNDYNLDEITAAAGYPSQYRGNPETMEWVLARRTGKPGENLDTLFTTVFEPYEGGKKYITALEQVPVVEIKGGGRPEHGRDDQVKAVKVVLGDRTDYIVYATNTDILYRVGDKFDFQGFMGVYTVNNDGEVLRKYAHDATLIEEVDVAEQERVIYENVTGEVKDFTRTAEFKNYISITSDDIATQADAQAIVGKYIFVENDGTNCTAYEIKGAEKIGEDVKLDIGDITLIRRYVDNENADAGFEYDISVGDKIEIKNRIAYDSTPKFINVSDRAITAEKTFSVTMEAISPLEKHVTYSAVSLPRGAAIDSQTGVLTWTPGSTQVGEHHFAIKATDGVMSSVANFQVVVHKSVSSGESPSDDGAGNSSDNNSPPAGGGGGGESPSGGNSDTGDSGNADGGDDIPDAPSVPTEKFIDLGNHAWAKDAIYALVDKGVVNGTSPNTYSPANNIKRADFAIMLVRAFGITEGEGENFADVDANKYYAEELRLAKANGIVNGVGENKFNPEGEITRQDMMLMITRALEAQGKKLAAADENVLAQFADAAEISDYAKQAVASVVKAGIITGSNGRINPLAKATRAEIAVMLSRVLAQ